MADYVGMVFIVAGLFFFGTGLVGLLRLPDALSRLHASGKVGTLGLFGILVGAGMMEPAISPKLFLLGMFMLVVSPVTTHAIALAHTADKSNENPN